MSTQETSKKPSATLAEKTKGAIHVAHGVTESIFGSVMGAAETEGAKAENQETVAKGRAEIQQGYAKLKGEPAPGTTTIGAESQGEGKGAQPPQAGEKQDGTVPVPPQTAQQQERTGQSEAGNAQKEGKETQEDISKKHPEGGLGGLIGDGADYPQGPGSSI